jgi:hypothetical protein
MATGNKAREAGTTLFTLLPEESTTLDVVAFDHLVRIRGVKFVHHRAIPCPVGLTDENDVHRTHADHSGCSNGFIYKPIGRVTAVFTSNATDPKKVNEGMFDGSTVVITFPRFYDEPADKRIMVRPIDRLYLEEEDLLVAIWDKTHRRNDGQPDRAEFPIVKVEHLVDANEAWWTQGVDFDVIAGNIVWRAGRGPATGTVFSVWYQYRPYWYIDRLIHEIRVSPVPDYLDGNLIAMERLAYGAMCQREYVYRNQQNDDLAPDNRGRKQRGPDSPEPSEVF